MIEGLGDLIILVCLIGLALIVWRIHRKFEQFCKAWGILTTPRKVTMFSDEDTQQPRTPHLVNPRTHPLG